MSESAGESPVPQSETSSRATEAASYLLGSAPEVQQWSGGPDWSIRLAKEGVISNPDIIRSFSKVHRADFLPGDQKSDEGYDRALQIGYGQTNSQPSLVGRMLEHLKPRRGHSILDVGSGSGWTTALLASVAGARGKVIGTERIPELVDFSKENLAKYEFSSAKIKLTESGLGAPEDGPYNRILVSAHMPADWVPELRSQLNPRGGIMVAPIVDKNEHGTTAFNQKITVITRHGARYAARVAIRDVGFVPLINNVKETQV